MALVYAFHPHPHTKYPPSTYAFVSNDCDFLFGQGDVFAAARLRAVKMAAPVNYLLSRNLVQSLQLV
jgi:hypothetical protein